MYKAKDKEEYKTTTIRIKKEHYNKLKDIAINDNRSTNYIINKIIIDYIDNKYIEFDFNLSQSNRLAFFSMLNYNIIYWYGLLVYY